MTVLDLISRSLRLLGAINVGDQPTAEEAQDALLALNGMVEAWQTERLMLYTSARTLYSVTPLKQVYSLGPTAVAPDWTGPRPPYIDGAGLLIAGTDVIERPLDILRNDEDWQRIAVKGVQSTLPTKLYYEPDFPNASVALWPIPTVATSVALYTPTAVNSFVTVNDTLSLPPGYARALPYNLALELAPEFDTPPSDAVVAIAQQSKADLKRVNARFGKMRSDLGFVQGGRWDYLTGELR